MGYIIRDSLLALALAALALRVSPNVSEPARWALWTIYGLVQGFVFTGLWIVAHECGHGAMFKSSKLNDFFGLVLHSFLGVPYFSWKYSHARHHRYANNMDKDTAFVPPREEEFRLQKYLTKALDIAEDAPAVTMMILIFHQVLGWPIYLLFNITAGSDSQPEPEKPNNFTLSHFDPLSSIFSHCERMYILLSDVGLLATAAALYYAGTQLGFQTVGLLYGLPYLWVNHWIVAITFLHHNHPSAAHFENDAWSFQKGALNTIDRDFGFIGRHLFHGIIEYHVIHHLFPRIPFYYAEEATKSIEPLLGKQYIKQDTSFLGDLWQTFQSLRYVEMDANHPGTLKWVCHPTK